MSTCHILFLNTNKWLIQQVLTFILQLSFVVSIFLAIFILYTENISACRSVIAMHPILYNKYLINKNFILNFDYCILYVEIFRLTKNVKQQYWLLIQHIPLYSTKPKAKISHFCIDLFILQAHTNQERFWCSVYKLSAHVISYVCIYAVVCPK